MQQFMNRIINADALDFIKTLPDKCVDLVVTDPPYFLPATHYNTRKKFSRNFSDLGVMEHFIKDLVGEFDRVVKDDGCIYMFCDGQSYPLFYYHLFLICKSIRPLIWDKKVSFSGYSWRHQHELIAFGERPLSKPVPTGDGDILRCSAVKVDTRIHPAEKPAELLELLIKKSSIEGDIILDPFAGSFTTCLAARNLNRNFIGVELSPEYCKIGTDILNIEIGS